MSINWVKCSDRLPKYAQWVLVFVPDEFNKKQIHVGRMDGIKSFEIGHCPGDYYGERCAYPTHWAEIEGPVDD